MSLIVNLIKDFLDWLKPKHNNSQNKPFDLISVIIVFVLFFFVVALFGMLSIRVMLKYLNLYGLISGYSEMVWMFYGLILGISFALFGQSFPSFDKKDYSPDILYSSFKHHFKYLVYFIFAIMLWCGVILIILRFTFLQ